MSLKELRTLLHKELSLFYINHGFDLHAKTGTFVKGEFDVFFGVARKSRDSLHFSPLFSVNNIEVFNVLNQFFPKSTNLTIVKGQGGYLARAFGCNDYDYFCLLYTSPSPRDRQKSRMPSSA